MSEAVRNLIGKTVRLTRNRSAIRYSGTQKATIYALGLRKRHATRELMLDDSIAGMVDSVSHMLDIELIEDGTATMVQTVGSSKPTVMPESREPKTGMSKTQATRISRNISRDTAS